LRKVTVSRTEDILFSSTNAKPKKKWHFENSGVSILGTSILLSGSSSRQNGRNSMNISMKSSQDVLRIILPCRFL
jgi:curli biogenesis system outer membrane secretion channel CsgG